MEISIRERLESLRVTAASKRYFIPEGLLETVLTNSIIRGIIEKSDRNFPNPLEIQKYVLKIREEAFKITAILILLGKEHLLVRHFIHKELFDRRLPLTESDLQGMGENASFTNEFILQQYMVLAPHFRKGAIHRALDNSYILPFVKDDPVTGAEGAFGVVSKVEIHTNHQSIDVTTKKPVLFARKEFRLDRTTEAEFQAEKDALELLLELKHENIIELFATYAYGPHFNLLMPWVDLTLFNYLRSAKPPINLTEKVALFEEMVCVASALDAIHNFEIDKDGIKLALMGCHHDLKPQNILVQGTKFLIADFGLARFKELDQQSETRWKLGTRTYGPPEAGSGTKVSRPHDIWSFGCILSEVATFAQLGPAGIEGFVSHRTTKVTPESSIEKDYFHNKTSVKPEVLEWLQHLHEPVTDTIMPSVTTLVRRLLDPNPRTRPGAKFAQEALAKIVKVYGIDKIHDMPEKRTRENDNLLSTNEDGKYLIPTGTEPTNASHLPNEKSIRDVEDSSWPLIHVAAMRGEQQTVHRILTLEHPHASIASNNEGDTALHTAAKYGQTGVIDAILKFNAGHSLHSNMALRKNASGRTPLHLAAENGNKDCAVKIKQSMPDIDHVRDLLEEKDDFGKTPLNLAQENGHDFMLGCLSSAPFCY